MPRKAIGSRLLNLWARSPWLEATSPPRLTRKTLPRINHDEIRIISECAIRIAEQTFRNPQSAFRIPSVRGVLRVILDALLPGEGSRAPERIAERAEVA